MAEVTKIYKHNMHNTLPPYDFILYHITLSWFLKYTHNPPMINKYFSTLHRNTFDILVDSIMEYKFHYFDTLIQTMNGIYNF